MSPKTILNNLEKCLLAAQRELTFEEGAAIFAAADVLIQKLRGFLQPMPKDRNYMRDAVNVVEVSIAQLTGFQESNDSRLTLVQKGLNAVRTLNINVGIWDRL
jgi:hypothetical protein